MRRVFLFLILLIPITIIAQVPSISLRSTDGKIINIAEYAKQEKSPLIVSFFATWCKPCLRELKAINEVYADWQEETGVRLVAVSIDAAQDAQKVKPLADSNNWDYLVLLDTEGELKRSMQVQSVPHIFVFDKNGKQVLTRQGYTDGAEEELYELIKGTSKNSTFF